jgi:hypothetical protein
MGFYFQVVCGMEVSQYSTFWRPYFLILHHKRYWLYPHLVVRAGNKGVISGRT